MNFYVHFKSLTIVDGDDATVAALLKVEERAESDHECDCVYCTVAEDDEQFPGLEELAEEQGIYANTLWFATQYLQNEQESRDGE